jgi:hypothetical protein
MSNRAHDLAELGDTVLAQLAYALAEQDAGVRERLEAQLRAGNYSVEVEDRTLRIRIGGAVVMEGTLYRKPDDARLN